MKKQKVMSQMKGQYKTPKKQLNEVEIGHLPETEFRIILLIESNPDNHNGVITHLEPDILECEVKWALESITTKLVEVMKVQLSYFKS